MTKRLVGALLVVVVCLVVGGLAGAQVPATQKPQVVSPLGKSHFGKADTDGAIAKADAALAASPGSVDLMLAAGRARDTAWQYTEAIAIYSQVIAKAPGDVRGYRFRGHRYISTRRFDLALADLTKAASLAPSSYDVAYHLGLAQFLTGKFDQAARTYQACLDAKQPAGPLPEGWRDCSTVGGDVESRIATTDWLYRALRRAGRADAARRLLDGVAEGLAVKESEAYYRALLFYKGLRTEAQVLDAVAFSTNTGVTTGFGLANFYLVEGKSAQACALMRKLVEAEQWNGFGFIAAETELTRPGGPCGK